MFTDSEVVNSGFPTSLNQSRSSEDSSTQTSQISRDDQNTQTVNRHETGVQTEDTEERFRETRYDEEKLAEFLNRICPAVVTELDRVSRSNAFASYSLLCEEDEVVEVLNIPNSSEGVKVVDMSWSATGSVLAVACCHTLHNGWCDHQGHVTLHNIDRDSRVPSCTLNATSCIRSVSMHPYISSIVAAGTLTGEVLVWDTARETTLAKVTPASHNDSVSQVRWTLGAGTSVSLASSANDGHVILWKVSPHLSSYQVIERFTFDVSRSEAGVSAFAFPHHQQDVFVVCLEGGAMLHCSTTVAKPVASVRSLEPLKDPVIGSFEQHPATVTSVEFSPNHDDVFATIATDQAIRIFCLSQRCCQRVIWSGAMVGVAWGPVQPHVLAAWGHSNKVANTGDGLVLAYAMLQRCCQRVIWSGAMVGVAWSPVQAHVLAAWGHSNKVKLYNTNTGDDLVSLAPDGYKDNAQISCVKFNSKSTRLLAVGELAGTVRVWEIPSLVSTKTATEVI